MTNVTIVGNLTADPELRYTGGGKAVANFTIAESGRVKENGEWKDTNSTFWRCQVWDATAENMTESLFKGQRVIAVGEAKQRSYETREGEKRTVIEVTVSEVGPSLRWSTARCERTTKANKPEKPADDPWGSGSDESEAAPF